MLPVTLSNVARYLTASRDFLSKIEGNFEFWWATIFEGISFIIMGVVGL